MTVADAADVARIAYQAWLSTRPHAEWFRPTVEARVLLSFSDFSLAPEADVVVGTIAGEIVGWGARDNREHPGDRAFGWNYISDVWIDPAWQGRGIGSALIFELMRRIRSESLETAMIEVVAANTGALKLYHHLGFTEIWRGAVFSETLGLTVERIRLERALD